MSTVSGASHPLSGAGHATFTVRRRIAFGLGGDFKLFLERVLCSKKIKSGLEINQTVVAELTLAGHGKTRNETVQGEMGGHLLSIGVRKVK